MTKVKQLTPETKVERVLGADIESATYEELAKKFDEVREAYDSKTYGISFSQESISLLLMQVLPNVEWVGQQAWDISSAQKIISELKPDVVSQVSKESIRAVFQFIATFKFKGVDNVSTVSNLLTVLAEVIQKQISVDEQIFRDAGFELQAAEHGILPETAMQEAMAAEKA